MSYKLGFENESPKDSDKVFEREGVRVVVDAKSYLFLAGTELDYSGGLNGTGFTFSNPNAKRTCGCGSSFSV
jgi:iron-sulfur cluster assembly protein